LGPSIYEKNGGRKSRDTVSLRDSLTRLKGCFDDSSALLGIFYNYAEGFRILTFSFSISKVLTNMSFAKIFVVRFAKELKGK
jgi:hypothetical protein